MAIEIKLYQFAKKENSTKRPASEDLRGTFQCRLISPTSITAPSVELSLPSTFSVKYVNYAYIQEFDRYYWISGWTYSAGLWIASMTVDALASWRTGIGNTPTQYVTRSSDRVNPYVIDEVFPATNECVYGRVFNNIDADITRGSIADLNGGIYVLTTISNLNPEQAPERNMVTYYAMTRGQFATFADKLMASNFWQQVVNGTLDFTKYLLSIRWFPYEPRALASLGSLRSAVVLGDIPILDTPAYLVLRSNIEIVFDFSFSNIPEHPQKTAERLYLNYEPYSEYHLYWPPVGTVPIDGRKIKGNRGLRFVISSDIRSGNGVYTLSSTDSQGGTITQGSCSISCQIPISANGIDISDIVSGIGGAVSGLAGVASSSISQNWMGVAGGVAAIADGVGNTLNALFPEYINSGVSGNFAALCSVPVLYYSFRKIVETTEQYGHPLCEIVNKIKDLQAEPGNTAGFMVIPTPNLELDCTPSELVEIKSYMKEGFYYE